MRALCRKPLGMLLGFVLIASLAGCKKDYTGGQGVRASLNIYPSATQDPGMRAGLGYYYHWDGQKDRWEAALDFVPDWGNLSNYYITLKGDYVRLLKLISANVGLYAVAGGGLMYESSTSVHPSGTYTMAETGIGAVISIDKGKTAIPLDLRLTLQFPFGADNVSMIIATSLGYEF